MPRLFGLKNQNEMLELSSFLIGVGNMTNFI